MNNSYLYFLHIEYTEVLILLRVFQSINNISNIIALFQDFFFTNEESVSKSAKSNY